MRSPNVFGIFSLQILRFYWKSTILSNFRGLQYMIFRKIRCFWTVTYVSFRFSVFFTFWSRFEALVMVFWNFFVVFSVIFQLLDAFRWFWIDLNILSDFASMARAKQHRERQKWMRFYTFSQVSRRRVFLTNATPGLVFFVVILWWIFDDFEQFLHPWREQSNTGKDKN